MKRSTLARLARAVRPPRPDIGMMVPIIGCKGGVGKTTVALNLGLALAKRGYRVGIVDADITTPNLTPYFGLGDEPIRTGMERGYLMQYPVESDGMKLFSIANVAGDRAIQWTQERQRQYFLDCFAGVEWGKLDYMLVDMPPTTSDALFFFEGLFRDRGRAVLVTLGDHLSLLDTTRGIKICRLVGIPLAGVVENMTRMSCPCCGGEFPLFGTNGVERLAAKYGIEFFGSLPWNVHVNTGDGAKKSLYDADPDDTALFDRIVNSLER